MAAVDMTFGTALLADVYLLFHREAKQKGNKHKDRPLSITHMCVTLPRLSDFWKPPRTFWISIFWRGVGLLFSTYLSLKSRTLTLPIFVHLYVVFQSNWSERSFFSGVFGGIWR